MNILVKIFLICTITTLAINNTVEANTINYNIYISDYYIQNSTYKSTTDQTKLPLSLYGFGGNCSIANNSLSVMTSDTRTGLSVATMTYFSNGDSTVTLSFDYKLSQGYSGWSSIDIYYPSQPSQPGIFTTLGGPKFGHFEGTFQILNGLRIELGAFRGGFGDITFDPPKPNNNPIPEPSTIWLLGYSLLGIMLFRKVCFLKKVLANIFIPMRSSRDPESQYGIKK